LSFCDRLLLDHPNIKGKEREFLLIYSKINQAVRYLKIDWKTLELLTFSWLSGYKDVSLESIRFGEFKEYVQFKLNCSSILVRGTWIRKNDLCNLKIVKFELEHGNRIDDFCVKQSNNKDRSKLEIRKPNIRNRKQNKKFTKRVGNRPKNRLKS